MRRHHGLDHGVGTEQRAGEVLGSSGHRTGELLGLGQLDHEAVQDIDIARLRRSDAEG